MSLSIITNITSSPQATKRWTGFYFWIAMIENLNTQIGILVNDGQQNHVNYSIPVPVAVEFNTDEAWQNFQDPQISYDLEYATTVCGTL